MSEPREGPPFYHDEHGRQRLTWGGEQRLRAELDAARRELTELREALNRAANRLAQVQPAIDTACTWALDIVPEATREIADVLSREGKEGGEHG